MGTLSSTGYCTILLGHSRSAILPWGFVSTLMLVHEERAGACGCQFSTLEVSDALGGIVAAGIQCNLNGALHQPFLVVAIHSWIYGYGDPGSIRDIHPTRVPTHNTLALLLRTLNRNLTNAKSEQY